MLRDVLGISLLVGIVLAAPLEAASPYLRITPGGAYDVGSRVQVPDEYRKPAGHMAFTAVYELDSTWADLLRARVHDEPVELVPAVEVRPPGVSQQQVNETNKRLIDESKPVAAVVGLRAAGFDVAITGQGAEVESLLEGLPAQRVLRQGDIIVAVDGQPTATTAGLPDAIRRPHVRDPVGLSTVRRGTQPA